MTAFRLHLLGWTQEEIAERIGIGQSNFARDFLPQFSGMKNEVKKLLDEGIPHLEVAERYNMPLQLV